MAVYSACARLGRMLGLGVLAMLLSGAPTISAEPDVTVEQRQTEIRRDVGGEDFSGDVQADREAVPSAPGQADAGWSQAETLEWADWGAHPHLAGPMGLSLELTQKPLESAFERSSGVDPAMYGR